MKRLFSEKWQRLIKAISLILIGLAFIFVPGKALSIMLRIIGGLLLAYEAIEIYEIYRAYKDSPMFAVIVINEALMTLLSLMLLINPTGAVMTLSLVVGIYFLVTGAVGLYRSAILRDTESIVLNSVSLIVGFLLLTLPYLLADLITIILGAALVIKGVDILLPFINNKGNKNNKNDNDNYYM